MLTVKALKQQPPGSIMFTQGTSPFIHPSPVWDTGLVCSSGAHSWEAQWPQSDMLMLPLISFSKEDLGTESALLEGDED